MALPLSSCLIDHVRGRKNYSNLLDLSKQYIMTICSDADAGRAAAFWLMLTYFVLTMLAAIAALFHLYGARVLEVLKGFEKRGSEVAQAASQGVQSAAQGLQHDIQKIKNFGQRLTQSSNGGPTAESNNWEIDWNELIVEEELGHGNMGEFRFYKIPILCRESDFTYIASCTLREQNCRLRLQRRMEGYGCRDQDCATRALLGRGDDRPFQKGN